MAYSTCTEHYATQKLSCHFVKIYRCRSESTSFPFISTSKVLYLKLGGFSNNPCCCSERRVAWRYIRIKIHKPEKHWQYLFEKKYTTGWGTTTFQIIIIFGKDRLRFHLYFILKGNKKITEPCNGQG